jgi:hypothetical protein
MAGTRGGDFLQGGGKNVAAARGRCEPSSTDEAFQLIGEIPEALHLSVMD